MHRTRHESLDFLGTARPPQEDWAAFLSTSVRALSTAEDEPETESPGRGPAASPFSKPPAASASPAPAPTAADTFDGGAFRVAAEGLAGGRKPRGGSMSESLTSSTGSSPAAAAGSWRPLGRRLTAASVPPPPASAASSSSLSSAADTPPAFLRMASSPALSSGGRSGSARPLKHSPSLRDVVTACLSSSGSSFYDSSSSSSDDEVDATASSKTTPAGLPPPPLDADAAYAQAYALPALAPPAESPAPARANSLAHVKSPVLSSRKDSATWQLQDEEFLTSPRFGGLNQLDSQSHSLGQSPPPPLDVFGSAFLLEDPGNQFEDDFRGGSTRAKDMRASSVDLTFSRPPFEVNPPLPPPQEPMQRLRARSFSYSAAYGAAAFQPPPSPYGKQFTPMPSQQMPPGMPQDYPPTLRSFHGGPRGQHPPQHMNQAQPPPSGVRPPRVTIPSDSPMHQYHQYGPPMLYRRYSTDAFVAPPYRESFPVEHEQQSRQGGGQGGGGGGHSGRGMRSYSMEYGNFPGRPGRSQSMEGEQMFAEGPAVGYPSLSRSNSAGVSFDWPRGRMDVAPAPPLPPDARPSSGSGGHYATSPRPEAYYDVEFKRGRQEVFAGRAIYNPGEYVKVEADRGEDIGRIVQRTTDLAKIHGDAGGAEDAVASRPKRHDLPVKKIIGVASQRECEMLSEQRKEEQDVFEVCKSKVRQRLLPMNVIDAEYQFDRHKLTFFFEAERRIDFRELVRDLFAIYKTRIWLQQVVPTGKKAGDSDGN